MTLSLAVATALSVPGIAAAAGSNPEQAAFAPSIEVADVPTAQTLYARMFNLSTRIFPGDPALYPGAGVVLKGMASFNNSLQLGVGFKANNVVGSGNVKFDEGQEQVVAALAKLRVLSVPAVGLQAAVGYDGMGYGVTRKHGLYGVLSKDVSAGIMVFRLHAGAGTVRFRNARADRDVNVFAALSGALSEDLHLGLEWDDAIYNDRWSTTPTGSTSLSALTAPDRLRDAGSMNAMIAYAWDVGLRLELDFKNLFRGAHAYYRVLKIQYTF